MHSIFHECLCSCGCVFVCMPVTLRSWGQPFYPHLSGWSACLCVSAFSTGTISVEGKEHRETLKELLCTFE